MRIFTNSEILYAKKVLNSTLLKDLVSTNSNRLQVLTSFFSKFKIPFQIVNIKNHKHCIIRFEQKYYSSDYYTKNLIAHYDRCENTFGANDNSAACVQLAFFAINLKDEQKPHNVQLIFTDGEELNKKSVSTQGAFFLGLGFRHLQKKEKQVALVFDMCGRGETLVFSDSGILLREKDKTQNIKSLQKICVKTAKNANLPFRILPTAFSDNAGLLAAGVNSQLITMLPQIEIQNFSKALKTLKEKLPAKTFNEIIKKGVLESNDKINLKQIKPKTWNLMHTIYDTIESLDLQSFATIARFLEEVKTLKIKNFF